MITFDNHPVELSDLLELAVNDSLAFEKQPNCVLNMLTYGHTDDDGCKACMAGAVFRQETGVMLRQFENPLPGWMAAINDMRDGYFARAAQRLGLGDIPREVHDAAARAGVVKP